MTNDPAGEARVRLRDRIWVDLTTLDAEGDVGYLAGDESDLRPLNREINIDARCINSAFPLG